MSGLIDEETKKAIAKFLREIADKLDEGVPVMEGEISIDNETGEFGHKGMIHHYPTGVQSIDFSMRYQPFPSSEYEAMKKAGVFD